MNSTTKYSSVPNVTLNLCLLPAKQMFFADKGFKNEPKR